VQFWELQKVSVTLTLTFDQSRSHQYAQYI